jgi:SAM-dependent methyltransferase
MADSKEKTVAMRALAYIQGHIASHTCRKKTYRYGRVIQPNSELPKRSSTLDKLQSYDFIPLQPESIIGQLVFVIELLTGKSNYIRPKFLDAGCGPGNIMLLAGACGFEPHGIELDTEVIARAKYFNPYYKNIKRRNILTYPDYGEFDAIYYFCPINGPKQQNFEERVEDLMKVGAILIPHLKRSQRIFKDDRFEILRKGGYHHMYLKVKK